MLARRGHQRCHCNEESFGTLSRQLGNDERYRNSHVGVSGRLARRPVAPADGSPSRNRRHSGIGPGFDAWTGSASRFDKGPRRRAIAEVGEALPAAAHTGAQAFQEGSEVRAP